MAEKEKTINFDVDLSYLKIEFKSHLCRHQRQSNVNKDF